MGLPPSSIRVGTTPTHTYLHTLRATAGFLRSGATLGNGVLRRRGGRYGAATETKQCWLKSSLSSNYGLGSRAHSGRFLDRKSTRLNSSHVSISYAVFCLKK